jgi:hypothetical protein
MNAAARRYVAEFGGAMTVYVLSADRRASGPGYCPEAFTHHRNQTLRAERFLWAAGSWLPLANFYLRLPRRSRLAAS